jgi:membrane protein implicated in regulation of membrane protease activity
MALVYLFSLVVASGVLLVQIAMGGKGDADGASGDASGPNDAHGGGGKALGKDLSGAGKGLGDAGDVVAFFLSLRFWIFTLLAFGLSGSLLNLFDLASPLIVFLLAASSGLCSGLFAALAFRFVARSSASSTGDANLASGSIGRVLVPVSKGKVGKIRIVLKGQSVDLMARTDEEDLGRGDDVLVEEVEEGVAKVSKRPSELA